MKGLLLTSCSVVALGLNMTAHSRTFEPHTTQAVLKYWAESGRYQSSDLPDAKTKGKYRVRLTPEGSLWLHGYARARGLSKTPPSGGIISVTEQDKPWNQWISDRIDYDRYIAGMDAVAANSVESKLPFQQLPVVAGPGPIPPGLAALMPDPPSFAEAAAPKQHIIAFHDGVVLKFQDNVEMNPRSAYYRFRDGVRDGGTKMKDFDPKLLKKVLDEVRIGDFERRVFEAVSLLEGGFDSVNTYDTGYVSVGFIQFACLSGGAGSLGSVLQRQKSLFPKKYQEDFQRFGVDVRPDGKLVALDTETGDERIGTDAALEIIKNKRLIAVFQRAGRLSHENRVAQMMIAREMYYPDRDEVLIPIDGRLVVAKIQDFIKSEAGMATLMDRKVNTGKLGPIGDVASELVRTNSLKAVAELAAYEQTIISRLRFRKNYLAEKGLSQPPPPPTPAVDPAVSNPPIPPK